ncbi:SpoIIE family protein phosphatase [Streptomyces sp. MS2.AVA.5]|uniref:SpoIIE family protein phosphatase n=1 Tax=Streptomyces achmelvichensis TaxID=3134111 RepID=A0ACC6Q8W0_9ACTN
MHEIDIIEQAVLASLAGYTARTVERALFVDHRIHVVHQMQQAMLTTLPHIHDLEGAALYRSAAEAELVGSNWYDLYPLPTAADGDRTTATLAATVGDVTGHGMRATVLMGQTCSMLRQAGLDHPGQRPRTRHRP